MAVIALIEDLPEHSTPMAQALSNAGHKVHLYADEASALKAVTTREFDVILLDVELGTAKEAGHTILDHIERKDRNRVVVISGSPNLGELRPRMMRMGAWDYIPKPLETETLVMKVDRLLKDLLAKSPTARQVHGNISWDPSRSSEMRWKNWDIAMPAGPCDLVKALVVAEGGILTYAHLINELRMKTLDGLRSQIRHARDEFKAVDPQFDALRNEPRKGYFWKEN